MDVIAVGPHRFAVGTVADGAVQAVLGGARADIMYSDPPWGPGLLKTFQTEAGKKMAAFIQQNWTDFLRSFCMVSTMHVDGPVFVEMGLKWVDELAAAMQAAGIDEQARYTAFYGSPKRPSALWLGWKPQPEVRRARWASIAAKLDLEGQAGAKLVRHALAPWIDEQPRHKIVLDPCTGLGLTARTAASLGYYFAGVEPDRTRLNRAVDSVMGFLDE